MNLLQETIEDIRRAGYTPEEIAFIGSEQTGHQCTWGEFVKLADREYDSGFGAQEVARDLVIVFNSGAKMWREEYDGSEQWSHVAPFEMPKNRLPIRTLFVPDEKVGWENLEAIQEEE